MKKLLAVILALAALVSFSACGKESTVPRGMKLVASEFIDYSLYVPESWTVYTSARYAAATDEKGRTVSLIMVTPEGEYTSIDDYYKNYYIQTLKDTYTNVELTEAYTENQFLGGETPACKYVLSLSSGESDYTVMQVLAGHSYYLYILTYFAPADLYEEGLDTVSDIIDNFAF